jgi:cyclic-di-GMP-binding protein
MLTLPLEPTDDRANPFFKDAAGCTQWLGQLQLTNLQLAHSLLFTQINELNRYPMRGMERLNTLELLRETVGYVQDDYAKKLIAKPLPLNESEQMVFVALVQLWQAMVLGYQRCLQAYMAGDKQLAKHGALLCQRCLLYSGLGIFEHLRTGYEFDARLWNQLHELYAFAEEQNFQAAEVDDPLNQKYPHSSCRSIYVKTLLACYARPAELTRSQLQLLDNWLAQWSGTVTVERSYTASKGDAQPLAIDMASTQGLRPVKQVTHSDTMRYLAMVPLSKLLRVKTILLQQGQTPRQAGLCEHCNSNDCIEFLTFLHQCWCEDHSTRFGDRRPVAQHAQLCCKPEGIYAHLSGKLFKQPGRDNTLGNAARKQIEAFGRVLQDAHDKEPPEMGYPLETWQFENESISGARLTREDTFGGRLSYNQLVALRPSDTGTFMLGATAWANVTRAGQLQIGVRYMPGSAEAVSIRATGVNMTVPEKYVPAFLLSTVVALNIPASLIIPRDWFQPGRVVEVLHQNGEKDNVKMGFSVERGIDYERVSFTLAY